MYKLCARYSFSQNLRLCFIYHCINILKPILWMKSVPLVFFTSPLFQIGIARLVFMNAICNFLTILCVAYSVSMPCAHDSETHRVGTSLKSNYFNWSGARLNVVFHFTQFKYELRLIANNSSCWMLNKLLQKLSLRQTNLVIYFTK